MPIFFRVTLKSAYFAKGANTIRFRGHCPFLSDVAKDELARSLHCRLYYNAVCVCDLFIFCNEIMDPRSLSTRRLTSKVQQPL